eukprot:jgi/Tetstr1/430157/TSEL_019989.t1
MPTGVSWLQYDSAQSADSKQRAYRPSPAAICACRAVWAPGLDMAGLGSEAMLDADGGVGNARDTAFSMAVIQPEVISVEVLPPPPGDREAEGAEEGGSSGSVGSGSEVDSPEDQATAELDGNAASEVAAGRLPSLGTWGVPGRGEASKESARPMAVHTVGASPHIGRRSLETRPASGQPREVPIVPKHDGIAYKTPRGVVYEHISVPASPRFRSSPIGKPGPPLPSPRHIGGAGCVSGKVVPHLDLSNAGSATGDEPEVADTMGQAEATAGGSHERAKLSSAEAARTIISTWSPRLMDSVPEELVAGSPGPTSALQAVRTQQGRFTTRARRVGEVPEGPHAQDLYGAFRPTHRPPEVCDELGEPLSPEGWASSHAPRFGTTPRFWAPGQGGATSGGAPPLWTGGPFHGLCVDSNGNGAACSGYQRPRAASMPERLHLKPTLGTVAHNVWSNPYRGTSAMRSTTSRDGHSRHFSVATPAPNTYNQDGPVRKNKPTGMSLRGSASFASSAIRTLPHEPVTFSGKYVRPAKSPYSSAGGDIKAWRRPTSYTGSMCTSPRRSVLRETDSAFLHPRPRPPAPGWRDMPPHDEGALGPGSYDPPRWPAPSSAAAQEPRPSVIAAGFTSRRPARQQDAAPDLIRL